MTCFLRTCCILFSTFFVWHPDRLSVPIMTLIQFSLHIHNVQNNVFKFDESNFSKQKIFLCHTNHLWSRQVYKFNPKQQSLVLRHKNALRNKAHWFDTLRLQLFNTILHYTHFVSTAAICHIPNIVILSKS